MVIQGIDQGARFEIAGDPVDIGRGVRNQIRIHDTEVSRQHATIEYADGIFVVVDQNSSNGSFVNGVAVRRKELSDGDQLQIGRTVILFSEQADDESRFIADKVDFSQQPDVDDRSSIIDEVGHEAGQHLLQHPGTETAPAVAQTLANLQTLYRITEAVVSPSISLDQLLKRILELTIEVVDADRGCVLVTDPNSGDIVPQAFTHRRSVDATAKMPVSRSIVDYVLKRGQGVRTSDARSDRRFETGESILQEGIREAMCVPMHGRSELVGVIYVDITTPAERVLLDGGSVNRFSEEQLRLMVAIGRQAAIALESNRYQQAYIKAERLAATGQTVAGLSHDIKNILQGVRGGSYLIDMGLKDHNEELIQKGWAIVEKNQNRIYHLVMDMLTFSKERQPSLQNADLNETVADVSELMQSRAGECGVRFEFEPAADIPPTQFDPEGIHRAVLNVAANAVDAVEGVANGCVHVKTGYDPQGDKLLVTVADNGPGIPATQIPTLFNAFESTKGASGTGLGLAVSRKIIREHGGEILVDSAPEQGTSFTLTWPRMEDEQQRMRETQTHL